MSKGDHEKLVLEKLTNLLVRKEFTRNDIDIVRDIVKYLVQKKDTLQEVDEGFDEMIKKAFCDALNIQREY